MNISKNETMTEQAAAVLERQILSGKYLPGSKLLGSRQLSEDLGVSRIVIRSALDRLAEKSLVIKRPNRGIYINDRILSLNKIELYVISYVKDITSEPFVETAMGFHTNFHYRKDFNLTLRCVGWREFTLENFRHEISKTKNAHAELILLSSEYIDAPKLDVLNENGIPYLIIGEMSYRNPNRKINQIYASFAQKADELAGFLNKLKIGKVTYLAYPEGTAEFETGLRHRMSELLKFNGKEFQTEFIRLAPNGEPDDRHLQLAAVRALLERGERPELIFAIRALNINDLAALLGEYGLVLGKDVQLMLRGNLNGRPRQAGLWFFDYDFSQFSNAVLARLKEIHRRPEDIRREDVSNLLKINISGVAY